MLLLDKIFGKEQMMEREGRGREIGDEVNINFNHRFITFTLIFFFQISKDLV